MSFLLLEKFSLLFLKYSLYIPPQVHGDPPQRQPPRYDLHEDAFAKLKIIRRNTITPTIFIILSSMFIIEKYKNIYVTIK